MNWNARRRNCGGTASLLLSVSDGSNILKPGAMYACYARGEVELIQWNENKVRNEPSTTSSQRLLISKWNTKGTHSEGAWRFDVVPMNN